VFVPAAAIVVAARAAPSRSYVGVPAALADDLTTLTQTV
jgi:hypothetical protein